MRRRRWRRKRRFRSGHPGLDARDEGSTKPNHRSSPASTCTHSHTVSHSLTHSRTHSHNFSHAHSHSNSHSHSLSHSHSHSHSRSNSQTHSHSHLDARDEGSTNPNHRSSPASTCTHSQKLTRSHSYTLFRNLSHSHSHLNSHSHSLSHPHPHSHSYPHSQTHSHSNLDARDEGSTNPNHRSSPASTCTPQYKSINFPDPKRPCSPNCYAQIDRDIARGGGIRAAPSTLVTSTLKISQLCRWYGNPGPCSEMTCADTDNPVQSIEINEISCPQGLPPGAATPRMVE